MKNLSKHSLYSTTLIMLCSLWLLAWTTSSVHAQSPSPASVKEYKIAHIDVKSRELAEAIIKRLDQGESFADLAKANSLDTESGKNGGELDWQSADFFVLLSPKLAEVVKETPPGTYSRTPVPSKYGWHVVKINGVRDAPAPAAFNMTEEVATQTEQACLKGNPIMENGDASMRMMGKWISDPEICACQGNMIRNNVTPEMLAMPSEKFKSFLMNLTMTKGADCMVPVLKKKFSESCEAFFDASFSKMPAEAIRKKLDGTGISNKDELISHICSCMRPGLQKITTEDWVKHSMAAYNNYLERKRTGNPNIPTPPGPFDKLITDCSPFPSKP